MSILGSQFHMLALPWLVLKLTGSGLALGTVLMAAAAPRAALMLVGGAVTDAFSPRRVMLISNLTRGVLVAVLAVAVAADRAQAWHLLIFAIAFGCADAFFYPAYTSIVPQVLKPETLRAGNALLQGTAQLAGLLGPLIAGFVVGVASVSVAFWVDSASLLVASVALALMKSGNLGSRRGQPLTAASLLRSTAEGLRYAWSDPVLRGLLLVTSVVNLAFTGPFIRSDCDASAYGALSSYGSSSSSQRRFKISSGWCASSLSRQPLLCPPPPSRGEEKHSQQARLTDRDHSDPRVFQHPRLITPTDATISLHVSLPNEPVDPRTRKTTCPLRVFSLALWENSAKNHCNNVRRLASSGRGQERPLD